MKVKLKPHTYDFFKKRRYRKNLLNEVGLFLCLKIVQKCNKTIEKGTILYYNIIKKGGNRCLELII